MTLYDYIKNQYDQGKSDEEVERLLINKGYTQEIAKNHIETFRAIKNKEKPNKN
jgi:hypothetical protein